MEIFSLDFARLVLVFLAVYYLAPRRWQRPVLLLASYWYCATWHWQFPLVLALVTLVNFILAGRLASGNSTRSNRLMLWAGVGFNLLALVFFKYTGFFLPASGAGGMAILLPVGLSYYVLQAISYLVDVHQGQLPACRSLLDFAVYMAYFPRLLAGPIERAGSFLSQLAKERIVDNPALARAFTLILIGLVRKVVVADVLRSLSPAEVFRTPLDFLAPELAGWLAVYVFALYNDFAGYTDIVRGVSELFGLQLSLNFSHPLFSRSFSELWNRWHISLSHWLRDYVFFPLSRALYRRQPDPRGWANLALPSLATSLVSGLWHQASWGALLWGGAMGVCLVVERWWALQRPVALPGPIPALSRSHALRGNASALGVFAIFSLAVAPAVMGLPVFLDFGRGLLMGWSLAAWSSAQQLALAAPFLGLSLWIDWVQSRARDELVFLRWPRLAQAALLALALLVIFLITRADVGQPFIYQEF